MEVMCNLLVIKQRQKPGRIFVNPLLLHVMRPSLQISGQLPLPCLSWFSGTNQSGLLFRPHCGVWGLGSKNSSIHSSGPSYQIYILTSLTPGFANANSYSHIIHVFILTTLTLNPNTTQTCYFYLFKYFFPLADSPIMWSVWPKQCTFGWFSSFSGC